MPYSIDFISMSVGKRDITIKRGDDYSHLITLQTRSGSVYTPIDITGNTYTAQLRKRKSQATVDAAFTCAITDAVNGEITVSLTDTETAALSVTTYYWDLQQDAGTVRTTILEGRVKVTADVTR